MNSRLITAIAVFSTVAFAAAPALAQHGGGHGGGSGGHGGAGHAVGGGSGGTHVGSVVGHAVPRAVPVPHVNGSSHIVAAPYHPSIYGSSGLYYGYPYGYAYSYGYPYSYGYGAYPYGYPSNGYAYGGYGSAYGGVRIERAPRNAEVYADGYYVGIVDNFDGVFQHLDLDPGPHQIEIRAPGAPPIVFNVNVQPGRTITYRAGPPVARP